MAVTLAQAEITEWRLRPLYGEESDEEYVVTLSVALVWLPVVGTALKLMCCL